MIDRYESRLLRYATFLTHDATAAEDIVQTTFIKAFQNLNGFNHKLTFSSWIYRITHNEAITYLRKEKHLDHLSEVTDIVKDDSFIDTLAHDIDNAILHQDLRKCLSQLDPLSREIIVLHYYERMRFIDIADVLQMSLTSVGVRAKRSRDRLRVLCTAKGVTP